MIIVFITIHKLIILLVNKKLYNLEFLNRTLIIIQVFQQFGKIKLC